MSLVLCAGAPRAGGLLVLRSNSAIHLGRRLVPAALLSEPSRSFGTDGKPESGAGKSSGPFGSDKPTELSRRRRRPYRKSDTLVALVTEMKREGKLPEFDGGALHIDDGDGSDIKIDEEFVRKVGGGKGPMDGRGG